MPREIKWTEGMPKCDFESLDGTLMDCPYSGIYDGKTKMGPWANMCEDHLKRFGYPDSDGLTNKRIPTERG